ncbi:MAG: DNA polymerase I [Eubacteriales bacterium]|nr:DNA polymerase I [Eubacteriales bacterium]
MNKPPRNETIIVIDGNSLINRAYYAIQRPMITKEGLYTHAVYGFLNMLRKICDEHEADFLVVTFDRKAPTFRHVEYTEYKAQRKGMPPELAMQLPLLKEALEAMNVSMLEIDGFEADDIIGTVARRAEEQGMSTLIITGDRDALQLASKKTRILITKKGISEFELYDEDEIFEKYGFSPNQFIDYKGLMGDASDNIPGLPGVGEKTAHKLILSFGSVENLLAKVDEVDSEKLREKIRDNAQIALLSRRLAEIDTNVPIETDFSAFRTEEPDYDKLIEIYEKLEFKSLLKKLDQHKREEKTAREPVRTPFESMSRPEPVRYFSWDQFEAVANKVARESIVAIKVFSDHNHKDRPTIEGVSLLFGDASCYLDGSIPELPKRLFSWFRDFDLKLAGHQLQEDFYALLCGDGIDYRPNTAFDCGVAQYLLAPERSNYTLASLSLEYLKTNFIPLEELAQNGGQLALFEKQDPGYAKFGAQSCATVLDLIAPLSELLKEEELERVFYEVELPLIFVLASIELAGFAIDRQELLTTGKSLSGQIEEISKQIFALSGQEFNINSPKQLGEILFEKLGLQAGKKNKTGYSTNAEILEKLRGDHEIIDLILQFRTLSKLNSTYVEGLLPLIHKDGKIHPHFQQTVTATGRISCTEPNLQNIPIKQELGRLLRKAFIPENDSFVLIGADYSQIELRVLAHMSKDPGLLEAFNEGADIHRSTAARVFGVAEEDVTSLQRSNAKAVNFGVIYGMTGFGLSEELGISRKAAEEYIDAYFKKYPKVKEFMDEQVRLCREKGYVTTLLSRRRRILEIHASNFMVRQAAERLAMNTPIQGSAADIIKIAMIHCHEQLSERKLKSKLILQVHDELVIQASKDELSEVETLLKETMENAFDLAVDLSVSLNIGNNWYELK